MQIKSLRTNSQRSCRIDDTTPADAVDGTKRVETAQALRLEGCSKATARRTVYRFRAIYFRWLKRCRTQGVSGLAEKSRRLRRAQQPILDPHQ